MNNFTYENQGTNTYLVYEISNKDIIDSLSMGMLTHNKIPGLAQTQFTQIDSKKYVKFNVSAKISVSQFFVGVVNKKRLLGVFSGIVDAMLSAEDYMLDIGSIMLDMDYIFTDVSTCETVLVCLPIVKTEIKKIDLGLFFRNIMFTTQFDQTENCDHVAKIINYLNGTPVFSLSNFKKLLEEIGDKETQPNVTKVNNAQQPVAIPLEQSAPQAQPVVNQVPASQSFPQASASQSFPKATTPSVSQQGGYMAPPSQQPQKATTAPQSQTAYTQQENGKEMSFFYLMQHYNKENAAVYKAQKEAKKARGKAAPAQQPVANAPATAIPANQQPSASSNANFGFAVPGQAVPASSPASQPIAQNNFQQPKVTQSSYSQPQTVNSTPAVQSTYTPVQVPQGQPMNFGETTVLGGGNIGETTVLNATTQAPAQMNAPHLIRVKNNEKISLNKPVFRIGTERSYVDYFVSDNTAISRSHASIIIRGGDYFITDTNSKNHTYVNGSMIQSNMETKISHGDKIRLADEDFEFKLY